MRTRKEVEMDELKKMLQPLMLKQQGQEDLKQSTTRSSEKRHLGGKVKHGLQPIKFERRHQDVPRRAKLKNWFLRSNSFTNEKSSGFYVY